MGRAVSSSAVAELSVAPQPGGVNARFGGTVIWAPSQPKLVNALGSLQASINSVCAGFLSCGRPVLRAKVTEELGLDEIDDRVFGAVLGRLQCLGAVGELLVFSKSDKIFRVYYASANEQKLAAAIKEGRKLLAKKQRVLVKDLEQLLFPRREYNTWSAAQHVLGHLSYVGVATQVDDMTFSHLNLDKMCPP
jgi:hypothetical protein